MRRIVFAAFAFLFLGALPAPGAEPVSRWRTERLPLSVAEATLRIPADGARGRLPALLIFGGFEEAGKVLELVHPDRPVLLASFDYPYRPPRKFEFPGSLRFAPEVKRAVHETLRGIRELQAALARRPDVDSQKISILGASFGAPFAAQRSAPPFAGVILVHGFGDVPGTAMHQLLRSWRERFGLLAYPLAWLLTQLSWTYLQAEAPEVAVEALTSDQHVLVITAENDSFIPPASSEALWAGIKRSPALAEREIMPGDHLQPGSDELIARILHRVSGWMAAKGLL